LAVSSLKVTVHNLTRLLHRQGEIAVLKRWEGLRDNIEGVVHNYGLVASEMSGDLRFSEEFKVVKQQAISRSTQALIYLAIALWIFGSEFPEIDGGENTLLKAYRKTFLSNPGS